MLRSLNNASKTTWNFSKRTLISIFIDEKYCETRISLRFNLSKFVVFKNVCLTMSDAIAWSMKMIVKEIWNASIRWRIFLITQIMSIISSSVNQYRVSVEMRILLKNMIDWMFDRLNTTSSSRSLCTWKIMILMSRFFEEFTSIKNLRKTRQWWRNLLSLKVNWKCSYEISFVSMRLCNMIFFENIFRSFSLMKLSFSRKVFRCYKSNEIRTCQETYIRKWSVKST